MLFAAKIFFQLTDAPPSTRFVSITEGWKASDFTFTRYGNDLLIVSKIDASQVQVVNYFYDDASTSYAIDRITFDNGTELDIAAVTH